ncbi:hypothetical protein MMC27_005895 [Xylographa pallens]|nr:hypothetical protein [Xylographa pallens]
MSPIEDLSQDVLVLIFQELYGESQPLLPLKNLNLTCRAFHVLATSLLFQHVILDLTRGTATRCTSILALLKNQATVRCYVRHITIPLPNWAWQGKKSRTRQNALGKVLPLLPRLQTIRLGGDICIGTEMIDLRPIQDSLLLTINRLGTQPSLVIDCYVPNVNWSKLPDGTRCLRSLRVCLGSGASSSSHTGTPTSLLPIRPSTYTVQLVSQNPALRDLHLVMAEPILHMVEGDPPERTYALERIGLSLRQLQSLSLEGDLHFTDKAWITWTSSLNWKQLRSLTIAKLSLIEDFASRCTGDLPSLHTLKLSAYSPRNEWLNTDFVPLTKSISKFLGSLQLNCLSLEGFHPSILLDALKPTLRYVRFHVRESEVRLANGSHVSTLRLTTKHIDTLRSACPSLYWLGLDAEDDKWCYLDEPITVSAMPASPMTSSAPATYRSSPSYKPPYGQTVLLTMLDMLATIRSLCHIRLFFYNEPVCKAMLIFTYLRTRKQGFPLRSLVIRTQSCVWIVWELGSEKATLEYHQYATNYREIWDTVNMSVLTKETISGEAWIEHRLWGCAEGW